MRTIQVALDDHLVVAVDKVVKKLRMTRSAFTRQALRNAVAQANIQQMENKHKRGYERMPVGKSEFNIWESEQEWVD